MTIEISKHYVSFDSPGTFFHETTTKEIPSWDVNKAVAMARKIKESYGATPFRFQFFTRERSAEELDSHIANTSGYYYLGGVVKTIDELRAENNPKNKILINNIMAMGCNRVIINNNSYKMTQPFTDSDIVLEYEP